MDDEVCAERHLVIFYYLHTIFHVFLLDSYPKRSKAVQVKMSPDLSLLVRCE